MKFFITVALAMLIGISVCLCMVFPTPAHSFPVTLDCTIPLYMVNPGSCLGLTDTCKTISTVSVYAQLQGRTDSVLVFTGSVAGEYGKPLSVTFDRPTGIWNFWNAFRDSTFNRSCNSNRITKSVFDIRFPAAVIDLRAR